MSGGLIYGFEWDFRLSKGILIGNDRLLHVYFAEQLEYDLVGVISITS